jgi:large subunit ribosomal protein L17
MRHHVFGRKLNRDTKSRQQLFRNLVKALIEKGKIETNQVWAKAIKGLVDKLVCKAKNKTPQGQQSIEAFFGDKKTAQKLIDIIAPRYKNITGGFTRIINLGPRQGDNAPMVKMQFVEWQDTDELPKEQKIAKVKKVNNTKRKNHGDKINKKK